MHQRIDISGKVINLGDTVARAVSYGSSPRLYIAKVTKVDEQNRIYLDGSPQYIRLASTTLKVIE